MNGNKWFRQIHRWMSVIFVVLVLINIILIIVPLGNEEISLMAGYITLLPLVFLLITGVYLFALPYIARQRNRQRTD